jgi:hypothetical protein
VNGPSVPGDQRQSSSWLRYAVIGLVVANVLLLVVDASRDAGRSRVPGEEPSVSYDPGGVPEIRLLRELTATSAEATGAECFTVGPFERRARLDEVREALREFALSVTLRGTGEPLIGEFPVDDKAAPPFWLDYAQPQGTVLAAQRIARVVDPDLHRPVPCVSLDRPQAP